MPPRKPTRSNPINPAQPELPNFTAPPDYDDVTTFADLSPPEEAEMVHILDTEGISAEEARRKALGVPAVSTSFEMNASDLPEISRLERFATVKENHGFFPLSLRQISEVITLDAFESVPGGAAKHLAEIAVHQGKHDASPTKATMSVVAEYGKCASSARSDVTALAQLHSELKNAEAHPFTTVGDYAVTARGLLVRHFDLEALAKGKLSPFAPSPISGYSGHVEIDPREYARQNPDRQLQEYIDRRLSGIRLDEAYKATGRAIEDRKAAKEYWVEQLMTIHKHTVGPAQVVAMSALEKLGVKV